MLSQVFELCSIDGLEPDSNDALLAKLRIEGKCSECTTDEDSDQAEHDGYLDDRECCGATMEIRRIQWHAILWV